MSDFNLDLMYVIEMLLFRQTDFGLSPLHDKLPDSGCQVT